MMLASIVGPVGAIGCTVGTQKTFPVVPRHTLGSYFTFFSGNISSYQAIFHRIPRPRHNTVILNYPN